MRFSWPAAVLWFLAGLSVFRFSINPYFTLVLAMDTAILGGFTIPLNNNRKFWMIVGVFVIVWLVINVSLNQVTHKIIDLIW